MKKRRIKILGLLLVLLIGVTSCTQKKPDAPNYLADNEAAFEYLKNFEGKWIVNGGEEGIFEWEFDITAREGVIVERLKKGTPTEMLTVYNLKDGILKASHFCQLQNQPKLTAVVSETTGDLHFLCNGEVGNVKSHTTLHMHGVHFMEKDASLVIWMDMMENGEKAFETRYELFRAESEKGKLLTLLSQ